MFKKKIFKLFRNKKKEKNSASSAVTLSRDPGPPVDVGGQKLVADEGQTSAPGTTAEVASTDPPLPPFLPVADTSPEANDRPAAQSPTAPTSVLADRVDKQKSAVPGFESWEGNFAELHPILPNDSDTLPVPMSPPVLRDQPEELLSTLTPTHTSQGILEGAKDFKIENSVLTNVQGNAMIFKLNGDGPLNKEFKLWFADYVAGFVTVEECDKLQKHILSQAVRNLPRANAAYNDYTSKDRRRTTCFQGTRQGLLQGMATWASDPDSPPVYVLSGPAGMGKSTIAQTIAAKTDVLRQLGASFFFSREGSDRRNAEKFFTTIAFQLCNHDKEFSQAIGDALLTDHGAAAPTKEPLEQLRALILEPLLPLFQQRSRPVFVIVDALDECEEEDGRIVLKGLDQLVRKLRSFKVILTARPQPHLQYLFTNLATKIFYLQNIEDKIVDGDIRIYLKHNLSEEEVKSRLPYMKPWNASDQEIDALVQGAGGLFIIASTAVLFILDTIARDPESRLQKLLNSFAQDQMPLTALNNFYMTIIQSAVPEDCDPDMVERYKAVIGAILTAKEPLPIDALAELIGLSSKDIHAVLFNLQSVIFVGDNDNIPRVYHKSFPDYVTDSKRCKDSNMLIILREHHTQISTGCLEIMNTSLKRNILGLNGPAGFLTYNVDEALQDESVEDLIRENIKPLLIYACAHWASHVLGADTMDRDLLGALQKFSDEHLLHWVEALSWTGDLDSAHKALAALLPLLRTTSPNIYDILSDGLRFVWKFFETIEESPLHTYHSALLFTPTKSYLYQRSRNELLQNLCQLEGGPEDWDPLITTLFHNGYEGDGNIIFSQDSSQFASLADRQLIFWDAASGMQLTAFYAGLYALSDDFSVAVLSRGRKVKAYKVKNKAPFATQLHPSKVVALALSLDGSRIAAALSDGTVNLWDLTKDKAIAVLSSYKHTEFDADEDSNSEEWVYTDEDEDDGDGDGDNANNDDDDENEDDNIDNNDDNDSDNYDNYDDYDDDDGVSDFDDLDEGEEAVEDVSDEDMNSDYYEDSDDEETTEGDNMSRLAFSPTGDRLAFVSTDGVRLWNSANGEPINTLDHGSEDVVGLTFVPDRNGLLSLAQKDGSYNLRVWDPKGGKFVGIIKDTGRPLATSADHPLLAAARKNTVRLWDRESLSFIKDFNIGKTTKSLAFSQDMLAIASADNSITVYDIQANTSIVSLQVNFPLILAFSPDGTRLAAGNNDGEIRLWDVPGLKTYVQPSKERKLTEVTALAISPDCSRVASGFKDGTVQLWGTDHERHIISSHKIHSGKISALSFNPEGERFASGSGDKTVRFWNGKDGSLIGKLGHTFAGRLTSLSFSRSLLAASTKARITLWECESSRLVGTLKPGGHSLAFSPDGSILASVVGEEDGVTVWEVEKQKSLADFAIGNICTLGFSLDGSRILCWSEGSGIISLNTTNNDFIDDVTNEDLASIPHLNGIPITWEKNSVHGHCLVGRFSVDHARVPVLLIPWDAEITTFASRSSMFVVGCMDGRIFFIRSGAFYAD